MGAKPAPTRRSPEPNPQLHRLSSFQQKVLQFPIFSTPPSAVSKSSATLQSPASKPETPFSPFFLQKEVLLFEWWLIKTEEVCNGKRLAVGGFTKRGEAVVNFTSAPIIKRHDDGTLKTADGITLRLQGPINKTRTFDNGFSLEVSTAFLFGFPTLWDSSVAEVSGDKPSHQPLMGMQAEDTIVPSSLKKTVCLRNWWLKKTENNGGNMLAIGGLTELGKATRVFNSSSITKRHDVYTLETADGIIVRIQGFINKSCTLENGFSLEACRTFLIGFPTTWSNFANSGDKHSHKETPLNACPNIDREVIPKSVVGRTMPNSMHMPLVNNSAHHLPERGICDNSWLKVDESYGTNMRYVDEIHKADHTPVNNSCTEGVHIEAQEYQTSGVDNNPQEKSLDDGKLDFIQDTRLKNNKKCSGHTLTNGHHSEGSEIHRTGISSDSVIGNVFDKDETSMENDEFYDCPTSMPERIRPSLSRLENLHGEYQKLSKSSSKSIKKSKRIASPKVGNVEVDSGIYSNYLDETHHDGAKLALGGSESCASQPNETLVEKIPSSSNTFQEVKKYGESLAKPIRSEGFDLPTQGIVHGESQEYSHFLNETNNVNCSNLASDGSKTSAPSQPDSILEEENNPSPPNIYGKNHKFGKSLAKPVRRSERLALAGQINVHVESRNSSQLLDGTYDRNCAPSGTKTSATILPNYAGSPSSPTGSIPLTSAGALEEDHGGRQHSNNMPLGVAPKLNSVSKYGSTLTACLRQHLNNRRTSCDGMVRQVEETPRNLNAFTSATLGKNMTGHGRKKKDKQTIRSRMRVEQNDFRHKGYFTTTEENMSFSSAFNSKLKIKRVGVTMVTEKSQSKVSCTAGIKTIWVSSYTDVGCRKEHAALQVHHTPRNQYKGKNLSILTPESLSLKRSRSGRLLIPALDCSTRIIYEADGSIAGMAQVDGSIFGTSRVVISSSQCKGTGTTPYGRKQKRQP